jgi:hypothetical protein
MRDGPRFPFPIREHIAHGVTAVTVISLFKDVQGSMFVGNLLVAPVLLGAMATAECTSFTEARQHIGEDRCISGKVLRVKRGNRGVTFFDFCEDYRVCPFTVVVFPGNLRDIGDVRQLEGKLIEVHGRIKEFDGRAEIVLSQLRQLGQGAALLPPLPKDYDVEKKGRYSAGTFSHPKSKRAQPNKRQSSQPPADAQADDP